MNEDILTETNETWIRDSSVFSCFFVREIVCYFFVVWMFVLKPWRKCFKWQHQVWCSQWGSKRWANIPFFSMKL